MAEYWDRDCSAEPFWNKPATPRTRPATISPEDRHEDGPRESGGRHRDAEQQNVENNRPQHCQCQRRPPIHQQRETANDLDAENDGHKVRLDEDAEELPGQRRNGAWPSRSAAWETMRSNCSTRGANRAGCGVVVKKASAVFEVRVYGFDLNQAKGVGKTLAQNVAAKF